MFRSLFAGLLIIHGLIHIIGLLQETLKIELEGFTGRTIINLSPTFKSIAGIFWLITMLLFFAATYGFLNDLSWWILLTIVAVIISQILVILWWSDAKIGTVANALVIIGLIYANNWIL